MNEELPFVIHLSSEKLTFFMKNLSKILHLILAASMVVFFLGLTSCGQQNQGTGGALSSNVASQVYVPPGQYDEYYSFLSGGFSGQLSVYGLPSGRLFRVIPVFSVDPEKAYGFNEKKYIYLIDYYPNDAS